MTQNREKYVNIPFLIYSNSLKLFVLILSLLALQSCQRNQALPNALEKYHERIYSVLELEPKQIAIKSTLTFPDKNSLLITIPDLNINMREFYAIEGCGIKQLVAERNTALGKTQLPSMRLKYEWQLIQRLQSCIENTSTSSNEKLRAKMQDWLEQKSKHYPLNWSNMITQSKEFHIALSKSSGFIDGNEDDNFTQSLFDLRNLIGMKEQPELNLAEMETSLQSVQSHRLYARLWRSQSLVQKYLEQMTVDISNWQSGFTCNTRKDKEKLKIIRNVFALYFAQEVQAIGSQINHYHYLLKPEFEKLSNDPHLPSQIKAVIARYNQAEFTEYQKAVIEHVKMWQVIFKKCD
ncbi:MAG: hypothetical protein ACI9O6_001440 [Glaciecola sp.]|jgi:hypothetical protein